MSTNLLGYTLASRYSHALLDLVLSENKLEETHAEINNLRVVIKTSGGKEFVKFLTKPEISKAAKKKLVEDIFKPLGFMQYLINSFFLLIDKNHEDSIMYFIKSFNDQYNIIKNIFYVQLESPYEVDEPTKKRVIEHLKRTTKHEIEMRIKIDPKLVGGLRIICGEKTIDGTIARNFELMKKSFNLTN